MHRLFEQYVYANVTDTGSVPGEAGVTGVVFYADGPPKLSDGTIRTIVATEESPGRWSAKMQVNDPTTLHVVAVDGSGNWNDCLSKSGSRCIVG